MGKVAILKLPGEMQTMSIATLYNKAKDQTTNQIKNLKHYYSKIATL